MVTPVPLGPLGSYIPFSRTQDPLRAPLCHAMRRHAACAPACIDRRRPTVGAAARINHLRKASALHPASGRIA